MDSSQMTRLPGTAVLSRQGLAIQCSVFAFFRLNLPLEAAAGPPWSSAALLYLVLNDEMRSQGIII